MVIKKKLKPRPNLGQIAYEEIKDMILTGELEPGIRIVLDDLSERLNLSITPIRDALNKLEQEDLIVITPRTSHSVVKITAEDAADILDLRLMLEMYALQSAKDSLAAFPAKKFRKLFSESLLEPNLKQFIVADSQFHSAILAMSSNKRLPKLYAYLQNLIQVLSAQAIKVEGRIADANKEHLGLIEAIERKEINLATSLLSDHFVKMKTALVKVTEENQP